MSIEKGKSHGESEEYEDKSDEDHGSEQHGFQDEEGGPRCIMGMNLAGGWHMAGRRVAEAETAGVSGAKVNAKANRQANGDTPRASMDTKVSTTTPTEGTREEAIS